MGPKTRIMTTSIAPVARVFASSATATFPPLRRSPIIPEPTTAERRSIVPVASAASRRSNVTGVPLRAAFRATAALRFVCPDECAHELAIDLWRNEIYVYSLARKERAGVIDAINAGGFNVNTLEAGCAEFGTVVVFFQSAGDASNPEKHLLANLTWNLSTRYHVGDSEAATGLQHAKRLFQYLVLICRKIDHAVGDDDVYRVIRQRNALDFPFEEFDILNISSLLILASQCQHLIGHI